MGFWDKLRNIISNFKEESWEMYFSDNLEVAKKFFEAGWNNDDAGFAFSWYLKLTNTDGYKFEEDDYGKTCDWYKHKGWVDAGTNIWSSWYIVWKNVEPSDAFSWYQSILGGPDDAERAFNYYNKFDKKLDEAVAWYSSGIRSIDIEHNFFKAGWKKDEATVAKDWYENIRGRRHFSDDDYKRILNWQRHKNWKDKSMVDKSNWYIIWNNIDDAPDEALKWYNSPLGRGDNGAADTCLNLYENFGNVDTATSWYVTGIPISMAKKFINNNWKNEDATSAREWYTNLEELNFDIKDDDYKKILNWHKNSKWGNKVDTYLCCKWYMLWKDVEPKIAFEWYDSEYNNNEDNAAEIVRGYYDKYKYVGAVKYSSLPMEEMCTIFYGSKCEWPVNDAYLWCGGIKKLFEKKVIDEKDFKTFVNQSAFDWYNNKNWKNKSSDVSCEWFFLWKNIGADTAYNWYCSKIDVEKHRPKFVRGYYDQFNGNLKKAEEFYEQLPNKNMSAENVNKWKSEDVNSNASRWYDEFCDYIKNTKFPGNSGMIDIDPDGVLSWINKEEEFKRQNVYGDRFFEWCYFWYDIGVEKAFEWCEEWNRCASNMKKKDFLKNGIGCAMRSRKYYNAGFRDKPDEAFYWYFYSLKGTIKNPNLAQRWSEAGWGKILRSKDLKEYIPESVKFANFIAGSGLWNNVDLKELYRWFVVSHPINDKYKDFAFYHLVLRIVGFDEEMCKYVRSWYNSWKDIGPEEAVKWFAARFGAKRITVSEFKASIISPSDARELYNAKDEESRKTNFDIWCNSGYVNLYDMLAEYKDLKEQWSGWDYKESIRFQDIGFDVKLANEFVQYFGIKNVEVAKEWTKYWGYNLFEEASKWYENKSWKECPQESFEWYSCGVVDPVEADKWKKCFGDVQFATPWIKKDFSFEIAEVWFKKGISSEIARVWFKKGFSPDSASVWINEFHYEKPSKVDWWKKRGVSHEKSDVALKIKNLFSKYGCPIDMLRILCKSKYQSGLNELEFSKDKRFNDINSVNTSSKEFDDQIKSDDIEAGWKIKFHNLLKFVVAPAKNLGLSMQLVCKFFDSGIYNVNDMKNSKQKSDLNDDEMIAKIWEKQEGSVKFKKNEALKYIRAGITNKKKAEEYKQLKIDAKEAQTYEFAHIKDTKVAQSIVKMTKCQNKLIISLLSSKKNRWKSLNKEVNGGISSERIDNLYKKVSTFMGSVNNEKISNSSKINDIIKKYMKIVKNKGMNRFKKLIKEGKLTSDDYSSVSKQKNYFVASFEILESMFEKNEI